MFDWRGRAEQSPECDDWRSPGIRRARRLQRLNLQVGPDLKGKTPGLLQVCDVTTVAYCSASSPLSFTAAGTLAGSRITARRTERCDPSILAIGGLPTDQRNQGLFRAPGQRGSFRRADLLLNSIQAIDGLLTERCNPSILAIGRLRTDRRNQRLFRGRWAAATAKI